VKAGVAAESSGIVALRDGADVTSGEYSFTITDVSTKHNTRRQVQVNAYWPDQATAAADYHATFYMKETWWYGDYWSMVSYARTF
jgi:hypothetical protein